MTAWNWFFVVVGLALLMAAATTGLHTWCWLQRSSVARGRVASLNAGQRGAWIDGWCCGAG